MSAYGAYRMSFSLIYRMSCLLSNHKIAGLDGEHQAGPESRTLSWMSNLKDLKDYLPYGEVDGVL